MRLFIFSRRPGRLFSSGSLATGATDRQHTGYGVQKKPGRQFGDRGHVRDVGPGEGTAPEGGRRSEGTVGAHGLGDDGVIEAFCDEVFAVNSGPAADFRAGTEAALNFLESQVMETIEGEGEPRTRRRNSRPEAGFEPLLRLSGNLWTGDAGQRRRKF